MSIQPYHDCPRFEVCSAPKCPLDLEYELRSQRLQGEEVCKAQKRTRLAIGKLHPELKYSGLTSREYHGKIRFGGSA